MSGNIEIEELLERAKGVQMSIEERELQRRSFAYGNSKIENSQVTRESVDRQAEKLTAHETGNSRPK